MSKYKTPSYKYNEYPHKKVKGKEFNYIKYEGIRFRKVVFKDCTFKNCDYRNSSLGINGSKYIGCKWENSKFWGKYSSFGSISKFGKNAIFKNCEFSNVLIKTASMNGVRFINCSFSGRFESLILALLKKGVQKAEKHKNLTYTNCVESRIPETSVEQTCFERMGTTNRKAFSA